MSSTSPSPREQLILTLIHRYIIAYSEPPNTERLAREFLLRSYPNTSIDDDTWFRHELQSARKNVLTIIGRLERKGYINRRGGIVRLTNQALEYFAYKQEAVSTVKSSGVVSTQINVLGFVNASRVSEDLDVQVLDAPDEVILIPEVSSERETYALRVKGASMEHEGIRNGDYVIVEKYLSYEWPKNGEMIVTQYLELPDYLQNDPEVNLEDFELSGYTLKIYYEIQEKGMLHHRLSRKKDNTDNPHRIEAVRLQPEGRVIGVYRIIQRR